MAKHGETWIKIMTRDRYIVERGGVSYDERGYLRRSWCKLLGSPLTEKFEWTLGVYNATTYYTEEAAVKAFKESGLDGGVLVKTDTETNHWQTCYTI